MGDAEVLQNRREAFEMFASNGMIHACDLGVCLNAAGFKRIDDRLMGSLKQRFFGAEQQAAPFRIFSSICDGLSNRPPVPLPHQTHHPIPPPVEPENLRSFPSTSSAFPSRQTSAMRSATSNGPKDFPSQYRFGQKEKQQPVTGEVFRQLDALQREVNKEKARSAALQHSLNQMAKAQAQAAAPMSFSAAVEEVAQKGIEACSEDAVTVCISHIRTLKRADAMEVLGSSDPEAGKRLMARLHPDRVVVECAKVMLQRRFQLVNHCRNLLS